MSLIFTDTTLIILGLENIEKWLPTRDDRLHENIELCPFPKTYSIVLVPSPDHLLEDIDITEKLSDIALLPGEIFLYFLWEFLVFFYSFEIGFDTCREGRDSDIGMSICTLCWGLSDTPRRLNTIEFTLIGVERSSIFIELIWEDPWDIYRYGFLLYTQEWYLSDELICGFQRTRSCFSLSKFILERSLQAGKSCPTTIYETIS